MAEAEEKQEGAPPALVSKWEVLPDACLGGLPGTSPLSTDTLGKSCYEVIARVTTGGITGDVGVKMLEALKVCTRAHISTFTTS